MLDRARALLAQHADTTRLLGVDFLPLGRPVEVMAPEPAERPAPAPARPSAREADAAPPASAPAPRREPAPSGPARPIAGLPGGTSREAVRACHAHLTDPAAKLEALRAQYEADAPHQHFVTAHTNIVFGAGDPRARLMFVGEAPGETEDQTGLPFVGRAGQLLEKMILAMGLTRDRVYITNVLKTRPPNNATPTAREAAICAPYLIEQIRIVSPEVIVTLGLPATHLLLETAEPMRAARGRWWTFPPRRGEGEGMVDPDLPEIPVMPTYHPAFLLRSYTEENRRKVWSDLRMVMDRLGLKKEA